MKEFTGLLLSIVLLVFLASSTYGQVTPSPSTEVLPALTGPVDCELVLKYVDDAIDRAKSTKSTLIFVLKTKKSTSVPVAMTRNRNFRSYALNRGYTAVEAAVDFVEAGAERLDIYLLGKRLYTIPIRANGSFDPMRCWVKGY